MDILLISPAYPPTSGGPSNYTELFVREYQRRHGANFHVLTQSVSEAPTIETTEHATIYRLLPQTILVAEDRRLKKLVNYLLGQLILIHLTVYFLLLHGIHLVHTHAYYTGEKKYGVFNLFVPFLEKLKQPVLLEVQSQFDLPHNLSPYRWVICNSRGIYNRISQQSSGANSPPDQIQYVPYMFTLPETTEHTESLPELPDSFIGFAGSITQQKGIYVLLEAYFQTEAKEQQELVFIGPDKTRGDFPARVDEEPRVHYLGMQPHKKTVQIIQQADLMVLPSYSEGLPRVCLESFALNIPILFPEQIEEFTEHCPQWALEAINPDTVSNKIDEALTAETRSCPYPIKNHAPERIIKRFHMFYRQALEGGSDE